jgi:hypothetical protein
MTEAKITYSNDRPRRQPEQRSGEKLLISLDNIRIVGYRLTEDHEDYSPDSFDVVSYYKVGELTKHDAEAYNSLQYSNILELRIGTYKSDKVYSKK